MTTHDISPVDAPAEVGPTLEGTQPRPSDKETSTTMAGSATVGQVPGQQGFSSVRDRLSRRFASVRARVALVLCLVLPTVTVVVGIAVTETVMLARLMHSTARVIALFVLLVGAVLLLTAAIVVWLKIAPQHVIQGLDELGDSATDISVRRLPDLQRRLKDGETVDPDQFAPAIPMAPGEFGTLAFRQWGVFRVAVQALVELDTYADTIMFTVHVVRRTQRFIQAALKSLQKAERATSAEQLKTLYEVDHQCNRALRFGEALLVLVGQSNAGRRWNEPIDLHELLRAAAGEAGTTLEAMQRIRIAGPWHPIRIHGHAVAHISHVLAELLDNALDFSKPEVVVLVELVEHGLAVTISDQGVGIDQDQLQTINTFLHHPPDQPFRDALKRSQIGLPVVATLARKHGVKVTFRKKYPRGTEAIVLIPNTLLVVDQPTEDTLPGAPDHEHEPVAIAPQQVFALPYRKPEDNTDDQPVHPPVPILPRPHQTGHRQRSS